MAEPTGEVEELARSEKCQAGEMHTCRKTRVGPHAPTGQCRATTKEQS